VIGVRSRVLVVDDDLGRLQTLRHVLSAEGYDVVTAQGGALGLDRLRAEDFQLVLTDLRMPDLSGLELLAEIREEAPNQPVIIFTAHGSSATKSAAARLGAVAYVDGLWHTDLILDLVRQNIGMRHDPTERPDESVGPAIRRWVSVVVAAIKADDDLPTVRDWAERLQKSVTTIKRWCLNCGVQASDSLDFARALRIAVTHAGRTCNWYNELDIAEPKTMAVFLQRAGISPNGIIPDVSTFLKHQQFIVAPILLKAVLVTHLKDS
jgi:CheY-like chemotaxis protein